MLDTTLAQLEAAQLVRRLLDDDPAYIFKHVLTQDTAYESLLKQTRRAVHRQVAETIEQIYAARLDDYAALLAHHYAEAGDDAKTAEYALRAGDAAAQVFAYPEARVHYALALEARARLPDDEENKKRRADAIIKQVTVSLRSAGPAETLQRLEQAEALARPFAERADATREDRLRLARVQFWQGHALVHHGDARAAIAKMQTVMAIAKTENELALLAVSASVIGRSLTVRGQFAQAIPVLSDAITALEQTHDELEWIFSVGMRGLCLALRGDVAHGMAEAERTLVRANEVGTLTGIAVAHFIIALTDLFGDALPAALEHSRAVIETASKSGDRLHAFIGNGFLAWAQTRADQLDQAEENFARANAIAQTIGARLTFSDGLAVARAEYHLKRGDYGQALAIARDEIALAQSSGATCYTGMIQRVGALALAQSMNEPWSALEQQLAASLQVLEQGDAQIEIARTHFVWGKLLIENGRDDSAKHLRAREHLERAAAQFEKSGLTRELNETRALMTAAAQ